MNRYLQSTILIFFLSFVSCGNQAFASALYVPGQTLNPSCLPTDPNCTVSSPLTASVTSTTSFSGAITSPQINSAFFLATSTTATSTFPIIFSNTFKVSAGISLRDRSYKLPNQFLGFGTGVYHLNINDCTNIGCSYAVAGNIGSNYVAGDRLVYNVYPYTLDGSGTRVYASDFASSSSVIGANGGAMEVDWDFPLPDNATLYGYRVISYRNGVLQPYHFDDSSSSETLADCGTNQPNGIGEDCHGSVQWVSDAHAVPTNVQVYGGTTELGSEAAAGSFQSLSYAAHNNFEGKLLINDHLSVDPSVDYPMLSFHGSADQRDDFIHIADSGGNPVYNIDASGNVFSLGTQQFKAYGEGTLQTDADGNVTIVSDERLKDIQGNFTKGLDAVNSLIPITYKWKAETGFDTKNSYSGFSAQNVQSVIPEAVGHDSKGFLTLQDRPIIAALVNAVKELSSKLSLVTASSSGALSGITISDKATGAPYCIAVSDGNLQAIAGSCN